MTIEEAQDLVADLQAAMRYGKMVLENKAVQVAMKDKELDLHNKEMVTEMVNLTNNMAQRVARTKR